MRNLTMLVSWPYRLLAMTLFAVALFGAGWVKGSVQVHAEWDAATGKQALQVARIQKKQAEITTQVVTKYIDRVKVVHDNGDVIIKEVPVYVKNDIDVRLSGGFRVLHDAAASGELPDPARSADAQPVTAQDVASTIASNYQQSREIATQLEALQEWVRRQSNVH